MRALRALPAVWALLLHNRTAPIAVKSSNLTAAINSGYQQQPELRPINKPGTLLAGLVGPNSRQASAGLLSDDNPIPFVSSSSSPSAAAAAAFSVQRTKNFRNVGSSVTYDVALVPHPNMDMDSGTFTAPTSGVYLMSLEFWCWRGAECRAALVVNGVAVRTGRAVAGAAMMAGGQHQHVSTSTLVQMASGDIASVVLADGWLYSDARDRWTQFYGVLLHAGEEK